MTAPEDKVEEVQVSVLCNEIEMERWRKAWEELEQTVESPNVFTSWIWIYQWWQCFGVHESGLRLQVYLAHRGDRIVAVVPLVLRRTRWLGIGKLEFPDLDLADHMDPLVADGERPALEAIISHISSARNEWDLLSFRRLGKQSADRLYDLLMQAGLSVSSRPDEEYLLTRLRDSWLSAQKSSARTAYRAKSRKLLEAGFSCRLLRGQEVNAHLMSSIAAVELNRMVAGRPAGLLLAQHTAFFQALAAKAPHWLYLGLCERAGQIAAYELGFCCGSSFWAYTKGFDAEFAECSPGTVLTGFLLEEAAASGVIEYDMLRGTEEFKRRLSTDIRYQFRLEAFSSRMRSKFSAWLYFGLRVRLFRAYWRTIGAPIHPDL